MSVISPSGPPPAPPPRRARHVRRGDVALAAALAALAALTAWQSLRSEALAQARAAAEGRPAPLDLHTLGEAAGRAWAGAGRGPDVADRRGRPDPGAAVRLALDHLDRRPRDAEAARIAALGLTSLDYAAEAEPYYETARRGGALSREDRAARALGLARANLRDPAVTAFEALVAEKPDDPEALQRLATLYYSQKRMTLALEAAERLSRTPGGAAAGFALMGIVYHDDHKTAEAAAANEKVLAIDPELGTLALPPHLFYADLAQDLIDLGRAEDARRHLEHALKKSDDPTLMNLLGVALDREHHPEEAAAWWNRAIEADPKFAKPWLNLGAQALESNRVDEAIGRLETAAALDGESLGPAYQLSLAYRRAGRTADAERMRKKADAIRAAAEVPLRSRRPSSSSDAAS